MLVLTGISSITPETTTEIGKLELIYSNKISIQVKQGTIKKFKYLGIDDPQAARTV